MRATASPSAVHNIDEWTDLIVMSLPNKRHLVAFKFVEQNGTEAASRKSESKQAFVLYRYSTEVWITLRGNFRG